MRWRLNNVFFHHRGSGPQTIPALNGVSLSVEDGERLALVGANGSGKSTLARCLAGLYVPSEGEVTFEDSGSEETISDGTARAGQYELGSAALVFQSPEDNLIGETVWEEISLALEHSGSGDPADDQVKQLLIQFGLLELARRPVKALSGGEKQKLVVACALASGRDLIILDEPTSHLDPPGRRALMDFIGRLHSGDGGFGAKNPGVLLITQYESEARRFPRVVEVRDGRVVYDGTSADWKHTAHARRRDGMVTDSTVGDTKVILRATGLSQVPQSGWLLPPSPLTDINVTIHSGDAIGLCGPIGSGKTTLGYHLAGVVECYSGELIHLPNQVGSGLPVVLIQFPERQLFCATVAADVAFGPAHRGMSLPDAEDLAASHLSGLGLDPAVFMRRSPFELSGGEQRRVAMAGVAACPASLYILDEPTAALDDDGLSRLEALLEKWNAEGSAYLIISHDLDWLAEVTSRVWVMKAGRLLYDGLWRDEHKLAPVLESIDFHRL